MSEYIMLAMVSFLSRESCVPRRRPTQPAGEEWDAPRFQAFYVVSS